MSTLVLDGVGKTFGGLVAVDAVSLQVEPGHITGLIGPNGAGKTTLVNLISGFLKPTHGRIHFGAKDISTDEPHLVARTGIARTFQTIRLLKEASVLDNIAAGYHRHQHSSLLAGLLALPAARAEARDFRERAAVLLDRFGMRKFAQSPAGALSYGHQRRVEIMRALATAPSLLLLDEPVAGMNDVEAQDLGDIFNDLAQQGMALLLIEHNMRFVMKHCSVLHVLDAGRLIAAGSPAQVSHDPAVIAAYLGV